MQIYNNKPNVPNKRLALLPDEFAGMYSRIVAVVGYCDFDCMCFPTFKPCPVHGK